MPKWVDLTGQRFGRLVAVRYPGAGQQWLCRCDCGTERYVRTQNLVEGKTRSCGCLHRDATSQRSVKHGAARTPLYKVWQAMKDRCLNPANPRYADYGGRGITVAPEWMDFAKFRDDMGLPQLDLSLDRRDNDGPYCKDNCRWATRSQQQRNKRARP